MTENEISYKIEEAILKVYDELGPGLLEPVYEAALCYQMKKDGLTKSNLVKCIAEYIKSIIFAKDLKVDSYYN